VDHVAIVATKDSLDLKTEELLGVAHFVRLVGECDVAEAAVTVGDLRAASQDVAEFLHRIALR
jgi:hypothetical protein